MKSSKVRNESLLSFANIIGLVIFLVGGIAVGIYMERHKHPNQESEENGVVKNGAFTAIDPYPNNTIFPIVDDHGRQIIHLYNFTLVEPRSDDPKVTKGFDIVSNNHATHFSPNEDSNEVIFRQVVVMVKTINDENGMSFSDYNGHDYIFYSGNPFITNIHPWGRSRIKIGEKLVFYYPIRGDLIWSNTEKEFYFEDDSGALWKRSFRRKQA